MALNKKEEEALAEEQRRQNTSVTDLAREEGMVGNLPGGASTTDKKPDEPKDEPKDDEKSK